MSIVQENSSSGYMTSGGETRLATLCWKGNNPKESSKVIHLPVPYQLPPQPYNSSGKRLICSSINSVLFFSIKMLTIADDQIYVLHCFKADEPWSWDRQYTKKDVHGQVWPRRVHLHVVQDG